MLSRDAKIAASVDAGLAKRDKAVKSRAKKRRAKDAQAEIHVEWSASFREKFGEDIDVPKWGPKERSLIRRILGEGVEFDEVLAMLRHFISTWDQRPFDGVPSIGLMWNQRQRLFAEMNGSIKVNAKRERLLSDEWGVDSGGPSEGW